MYELHLFAGAGGGILGGELLGHTCVGAVEIEEYPRKVLLQRQRDGILPPFAIWNDVRSFTKRNGNCRKYIKELCRIRRNLVICGGFPCQDISTAGKGAGIDGERSGLWSEYARIIGEIRPRYVFVENSPALTFRGLGRVLGDLSELGYNAEWCVLGADDVGAPHERKRIWILASYSTCERRERTTNQCKSRMVKKVEIWSEDRFSTLLNSEKSQYEVKSESERMGDGIPFAMDRLKAIGNGQVPVVAATAYRILKERIDND